MDTNFARRMFDIFISLLICLLLLIPCIIIALMIKVTSKGKVIYWSERIGKNNKPFFMPKFRTMQEGSPSVATHLLDKPETFLTPIGSILRNTSLDEIPQIYSIIKGHMTFIGPRPALYNQEDLILKREKKGINILLPGITGWAQINGRDDISIDRKVEFDLYYLKNRSLKLDLKIIIITILKVIRGSNVQH